ncbi:hypothetical protein [Flavobacterium sp. NRK F10]|nr:hypothetical protein [Flavobacterium sp. NRK F10]
MTVFQYDYPRTDSRITITSVTDGGNSLKENCLTLKKEGYDN